MMMALNNNIDVRKCRKKAIRSIVLCVVLAAAFFIFLCVSPAVAQENETFTVLRMGRYMPYRSYFDSGTTEELAIGHYVTRTLVLEGGVSSIENNIKSTNGYTFRLSGTPVSLTLKGVQTGENFRNSVGIGWDVYYEEIQTLTGSVAIKDKARVSGYHISFAYDFFIGRKVFAGFEYKLVQVRSVEFRDAGAWVRIDQDGRSFLGNIGYRF